MPPQDPHTRALVGIVASIDNLTNTVTAALAEHTRATQRVGVDIVTAIDRLIDATAPPPLSVDALAPADFPGDQPAGAAAP